MEFYQSVGVVNDDIDELKVNVNIEHEVNSYYDVLMTNLYDYIYANKGVVLKFPKECLNENMIYRISKVPVAFDQKFWPSGTNDDKNELIFNSTQLMTTYLNTFENGTEGIAMCRKIRDQDKTEKKHNKFISFSVQTGDLNFVLLYWINRCIFCILIRKYLNTSNNEIFIFETIKTVISEYDKLKLFSDEHLNKKYYDQLLKFNELVSKIELKNYLQEGYESNIIYQTKDPITLDKILYSWNIFNNTRYSTYIYDRLYLYHLGDILDFIESRYNYSRTRTYGLNLLGVYCDKIKNQQYPLQMFDSECIIRKTFFTREIRNNIFYTTQHNYDILYNNPETTICNVLFEMTNITNSQIDFKHRVDFTDISGISGGNPHKALEYTHIEDTHIIIPTDKLKQKISSTNINLKTMEKLTMEKIINIFKLENFKNTFNKELFLFFVGYDDDKNESKSKSQKNKRKIRLQDKLKHKRRSHDDGNGSQSKSKKNKNRYNNFSKTRKIRKTV